MPLAVRYNGGMIARISGKLSAARLRAWLLAALLMALAAGGARAHGYIVRAIPADRSALERPPTRLQYWFSEDLEPRFSAIHLRDQSGTVLASGGVDASNRALLSLRAPPDLPDGAYIVELRPAFASDGHVIAESRVFFVGEELGGVAGKAAAERAIPLEALWRALLNLAQYLFFGASALYSAVLLPAWGSARYAAGLPPRVMRRLRLCLALALALAFAASVIALLQQTMVFFNTGAVEALSQNLWQVVLIGSRFGDVWTFRLLLLIFAAVLLAVGEYFRELMPQLAAGIWRGLPWLGALLLGASQVTGHTAGSPLLPWFALAVGWLHALAVAFWLGGALTLTLLLPVALAPYAAAERTQALRAALRRFSLLLTPLLALILVSGIYTVQNFIFSPADLDSGYGRALGIKALLLLPLLLLGAGQHIALRPQRGFVRPSLRQRLRLLSDSGAALRLEAAVMLMTLAAVAWLSATPVPEPATLTAAVAAPRASQTVGNFSISAAILPGGPGVNTFDIVINRAEAAADDVQVTLQVAQPAREIRSRWLEAEPLDAGLFTLASDAIDAPGSWWTLIDISDSDGVSARAAFAWDIHAAAAVQQARPPNPLNIVTLAVIAGLLLARLSARARRLVRALKLSPVSALIAGIAVAVSLGVMFAGAQLIEQRQREYARTLNPPPAVVNTVLPDAASLARGEALYRAYCREWQGQPADFRALRNRLSAARDDFLYAAVSEGWRGLPPCAGGMGEAERWDVVNYLRSLGRM